MNARAVVLYGLERSVYTRIARLALLEKAVTHTFEEVDVFGQGGVPVAHLERNPFGRIPVLRHGSLMLYETTAITHYVDEVFPGAALQPQCPVERARMNQIISILDSYAYQAMIWGVFVQRISASLEGGRPNEGKIARALEIAHTCLSSLGSLSGKGRWLVGASLSLADLHAYPILRYFALTPEGKASIDNCPKLSQWLGRMQCLASVRITRTEYEQQA